MLYALRVGERRDAMLRGVAAPEVGRCGVIGRSAQKKAAYGVNNRSCYSAARRTRVVLKRRHAVISIVRGCWRYKRRQAINVILSICSRNHGGVSWLLVDAAA